ncbi:hypothetical protein VTL71DRAFT_460 [Oculimacula yallundae]|uniref:Centromere protein X n=1 Tax=Oculimacula yallundae TaxID=86028 RepID=A0ABR4D036_9HELO
MPPKPFNPPRPSTTSASVAGGSKPRGRPKGSTNNTSTTKRISTSTSRPKTNTPSSKSKGKERAKDAERVKGGGGGFSRPRVSNASTVLNISSEDEDEDVEEEEEEEDVEMGEGEEAGVEGDSDDPFSSQPLPAARRKSSTNTNQRPRADEDTGGANHSKPPGRQATIPPDLVNVLLHGFFNQDNTRMTKDANAAVGMYIETFIREALNRAAWAKRHGWEEGSVDAGNGALQGGGDGEYLEVEDLERLAPQLLLDF